MLAKNGMGCAKGHSIHCCHSHTLSVLMVPCKSVHAGQKGSMSTVSVSAAVTVRGYNHSEGTSYLFNLLLSSIKYWCCFEHNQTSSSNFLIFLRTRLTNIDESILSSATIFAFRNSALVLITSAIRSSLMYSYIDIELDALHILFFGFDAPKWSHI